MKMTMSKNTKSDSKKKYHKYTAEQHQFLKDNSLGNDYKKLTDMFNKEFGTDLSTNKIKYMCLKKGYLNGIDSKIKNGDIPHNKMPVGTVSEKQGYKYIKIAEDEWIPMHHFIYKFFHGSIPENCVIAFIDNDKNNLSIDNLVALDVNKERNQFLVSSLRGDDFYLNNALINIVKIENILKGEK